MAKKCFFLISGLFLLLFLSGCPDEDTSKKKDEENEKIPNSMFKATAELEQVITLLGGPLFDSRDKIEQIKNQQIQMLTEQNPDKSDQKSLGIAQTKEEENSQTENRDENKDGQNGQQESNEGKDSGREQEQEEGQEQESEGQEVGREQESEGQEGENQEEQENSIQQENTTDDIDTKRPSSDEKDTVFQMEDSLFGIPQWQESNWKMIKVIADGLYFTWNSLQPELLDKGVSSTQITNFNTALEGLSQSVKNQSVDNAQTSVFQLTESLADFFSYYKTKAPPEIQRLKSLTTGIHFYVRQKDWEKAQELSNRLQQELTKMKASVEDNQTNIFQMLELSLSDLGHAVQKMDSILVMIRTNLVTANIQELETKLTQN